MTKASQQLAGQNLAKFFDQFQEAVRQARSKREPE
jgi:hypothetical protein